MRMRATKDQEGIGNQRGLQRIRRGRRRPEGTRVYPEQTREDFRVLRSENQRRSEQSGPEGITGEQRKSDGESEGPKLLTSINRPNLDLELPPHFNYLQW